MRIFSIIVRVLLGLLFIFASGAYFLELFPQPELTGDMKNFNDGIQAAGYLMPLVKVIELICGFAFVSGRFVPLALLLIAPIVVNIVFVHVFLAPEGLPVALFVLAATVFLFYRYQSHFWGVLASK